jgi:hypothetical protein
MARERYRFGPVIIEGWGIPRSWLTLFVALENLGLPSLERH